MINAGAIDWIAYNDVMEPTAHFKDGRAAIRLASCGSDPTIALAPIMAATPGLQPRPKVFCQCLFLKCEAADSGRSA